MAFTVVYDACVLYPAPLRDLLMRIAARGLVQAKWSDRILDECFIAIRRHRPELSESALARTRALMCKAVPDCLVGDYDALVAGLDLPDPDDRHVLAVAIRAAAQTIVTWNLKDFPVDRLLRYGVEAQDPDAFVLGLLNLHEAAVGALVVRQAADLKNPPPNARRRARYPAGQWARALGRRDARARDRSVTSARRSQEPPATRGALNNRGGRLARWR